MPEDLVLALLWEHERMHWMDLLARGLVKPKSTTELSKSRQAYLTVYWEIANALANPQT
jgi:hypothetical protein